MAQRPGRVGGMRKGLKVAHGVARLIIELRSFFPCHERLFQRTLLSGRAATP